MHPILASRLEQHDQEEAALLDAVRASRERVEAVMTPYRENVAEWENQAGAALLAGETPPPKPQPPALGADEGAHHLFHQRGQQLAEQRRKLLAAIAADVETDAAKRERELLKQARQILAKLPSIVAEYNELLTAVTTVRHPKPGEPLMRPSLVDRTRSTVDVHDLVDAVERGGSLLEPERLPTRFHAPTPEPEPRTRPPIPRRGVSS